jgi:hypothetical protein
LDTQEIDTILATANNSNEHTTLYLAVHNKTAALIAERKTWYVSSRAFSQKHTNTKDVLAEYQAAKQWAQDEDALHRVDAGDTMWHKFARTTAMTLHTTRQQDGTPDFFADMNRSLTEFMRTQPTKTRCGTNELLPYQLEVGHLMSPPSPVQRLIVYHRVGSGKTRTMIHILDQFFDDPRTKLVICPTDELCIQFNKALVASQSKFAPFRTKPQSWESSNRAVAGGRVQPICSYSEPKESKTNQLVFETPQTTTEFPPGPLLVISAFKLDILLSQLDTPEKRSVSANRMAGLRIWSGHAAPKRTYWTIW